MAASLTRRGACTATARTRTRTRTRTCTAFEIVLRPPAFVATQRHCTCREECRCASTGGRPRLWGRVRRGRGPRKARGTIPGVFAGASAAGATLAPLLAQQPMAATSFEPRVPSPRGRGARRRWWWCLRRRRVRPPSCGRRASVSARLGVSACVEPSAAADGALATGYSVALSRRATSVTLPWHGRGVSARPLVFLLRCAALHPPQRSPGAREGV